MYSAIWSILREAAVRGPSALADILVLMNIHHCFVSDKDSEDKESDDKSSRKFTFEALILR